MTNDRPSLSSLSLTVLPAELAVCRLPSGSETPEWVGGDFFSITSTQEEVSIVCDQERVPSNITCEWGWRCLKVAGPLDFSLVGVVSRLTTVLAANDVSVFVISSYDTDYLLVRDSDLDKAVASLRQSGFAVDGSE